MAESGDTPAQASEVWVRARLEGWDERGRALVHVARTWSDEKHLAVAPADVRKPPPATTSGARHVLTCDHRKDCTSTVDVDVGTSGSSAAADDAVRHAAAAIADALGWELWRDVKTPNEIAGAVCPACQAARGDFRREVLGTELPPPTDGGD